MNRLTVALFATSDANHTTHMNEYINGANAMLAKHSMALEIYRRSSIQHKTVDALLSQSICGHTAGCARPDD